jgi:hypothetical protein
MTQETPTQEHVQDYFKEAKEIKCLLLKTIINISYVKEIKYDSVSKSYVSIGGIVTFWKNREYAEITRKKCINCKECNCNG